MKMDVYNVINYLLYEQAELKEKHDKLLNLVREILEAVKDTEVKRLETKKKSNNSRCRYFNKGFCKDGKSCDFLHPVNICPEYRDSGGCSQGSVCKERHPQRCKFWSRGNCWRNETCVYLHNVEDLNTESDEKESEPEEVCLTNDHDGNEEFNRESNENESEFEENNIQDNNDDQEHQNTEVLNDDVEITTDEILKMYENVELDLDRNDQISAEDIIKMYETVESSDNLVKMSTRKLKQKKTLK